MEDMTTKLIFPADRSQTLSAYLVLLLYQHVYMNVWLPKSIINHVNHKITTKISIVVVLLFFLIRKLIFAIFDIWEIE